MEFEILDIIIFAIIAVSAIYGIFKGFVRQIVSILALMLGVWCAFEFTEFLSGYVRDLLSLEVAQRTLHIIMFIVILIAVIILANLVGKGLEGIIKLSMLGWMNRLLGFLFGAVKATIILSLIVYAITYLNNIADIIPKDLLADSKGFTFLQQFYGNFFPFLEKIFS